MPLFQWFDSLYILAGFIFGTLVFFFFWRIRKKKILNSIKNIVIAEKSDAANLPQSIEGTLIVLFERRKEELQRMQQLENYRKEYIGNIAHELKTPVFNIQGYLDELKEEELSELQKNYLAKADKNTARIKQLIEDLDQITKYEAGFLRLHKQNFDITELTDDVIDELEMQATGKKVFVSRAGAETHVMVYGDPLRIRQVLLNLGLNAIKYNKENGMVRYKFMLAGEKVFIEVSDNGLGIPSQDLPRIFERFYRVEKSRNRNTGGSGLGLSICKHIIDAHNSEITVISTEGAGSSFSFYLPFAEPN